MPRITKPDETLTQVAPQTTITRLELNSIHAYNFLKGRPTNKISYSDVLAYANEYKQRTGFDPSVPILANHFTTQADKDMYIGTKK